MREGTSGFWLEEKEGELTISYVDYGVGEFGGGDFECSYILNRENAEKFKSALAQSYTGTLEKMVEAAFGKKFNDRAFWNFCKDHEIQYGTSNWVS